VHKKQFWKNLFVVYLTTLSIPQTIQGESKVCLENLRACSGDQNSKKISVNVGSEMLSYLDVITEWRTHIPVTKSLLRCI
jgi:hypothetical protein